VACCKKCCHRFEYRQLRETETHIFNHNYKQLSAGVNRKAQLIHRSSRIVAWMFRLIHFVPKSSKFNGPTLSSEELEHAANCISWNLQNHSFPEELRYLRKNQVLKGPLKFLSLFVDTSTGFELIKVGGRLDYSDLPESEKHPQLLPSKSSMAVKYVRHLHTRNYHAGPKALVALLCLKLWIINARDLRRRIVRPCTHCIRYRPVLLQQVMGQLPKAR